MPLDTRFMSTSHLGFSRHLKFDERRAVAPLRAFLVLLFALLVVFQTLSMPGQWAHMAKENPEHADMRWPLTLISVFLILCAQIVVVSTWQLLTRVAQDRIFSPSSLVWVDAIVYSVAAAWLVLVLIFGYVGTHADDPGAPMLLLLLLLGVTVFGLLIVVMRALLRQATSLRTDLEAVI
jgi:small-conductance mechanosensitive channel